MNTICQRFSYDCFTVPSTVKFDLLRPSTIKHDVYTIYWTFIGFIYGPIDFCSIRFIYDFDTVELTRALCFMYGCIYGLVRAHTVLYDRLYDYTRTSHPCQFFKNHTRLTRIHSNGPSVSRIRPRFIRLYVRFTRVANRVFCVNTLDSKCSLLKDTVRRFEQRPGLSIGSLTLYQYATAMPSTTTPLRYPLLLRHCDALYYYATAMPSTTTPLRYPLLLRHCNTLYYYATAIPSTSTPLRYPLLLRHCDTL